MQSIHILAWPTCFVMLLGCQPAPPVSQTHPAQTTPPTLSIQSPKSPLEIVAGDGHLGAADFGEVRSCQFRVRNNAARAVTFQVAEKSCTCAGIEVPRQPVEPGQEGVVTVRWSPKVEVLETSLARVWAEISTGDEHRIRLEATGTIEPVLMVAFPRGPLDLGKLSLADLDQPHHRLVVEIYSKREAFPVPTAKFVTQGLEVQSMEPLTVDRLQTLQAKAGYRLTIKPNKQLAHGTLLEQLQIQTTLRQQMLQLPIIGNLDTSAISLSQDRFTLPPIVSLKQGYKVPAITLTTRYGNCTSCEVAEVTPRLFDAKVTTVNATTWRVELSIPPDEQKLQTRFSPEAWQQLLTFGFEQGSITLKLNHPDIKTLTIPITGCQLRKE